MLAIGRALMGNPILLLEPSVGIAHRLKIEIFQARHRPRLRAEPSSDSEHENES